VEINFDLTITALAELLGSQRETVSRWVRVLTSAGLLMVKKSRFIIPSREKSPRQSRGVLKISPWKGCVCGGTNPPHPQV
jgi:hypothetical protein